MRTVAIDVDGVLADFKQSFIDWFNLKITPNDVTHWDIFTYLDPSDREKAKLELSYPDFWRDMKAYPYAQDFVDTFRKKDVNVVIVTSPWRSCTQWDETRRCWIQRNIGKVPVMTAEDKRFTNACALLDDKPQHILDFNDYNRGSSSIGYLVDRPYNRDCKDVNRISLESFYKNNSWEELFCLIKNQKQLKALSRA